MQYVYQITEKNVDGCGGTAVEYVKANRGLDRLELDAFRKCLEAAKHSGEDLDTAGMVEAAMENFNNKSAGCRLSFTDSPFAGEISF